MANTDISHKKKKNPNTKNPKQNTTKVNTKKKSFKDLRIQNPWTCVFLYDVTFH